MPVVSIEKERFVSGERIGRPWDGKGTGGSEEGKREREADANGDVDVDVEKGWLGEKERERGDECVVGVVEKSGSSISASPPLREEYAVTSLVAGGGDKVEIAAVRGE